MEPTIDSVVSTTEKAKCPKCNTTDLHRIETAWYQKFAKYLLGARRFHCYDCRIKFLDYFSR